jgi:hypothetical protein
MMLRRPFTSRLRPYLVACLTILLPTLLPLPAQAGNPTASHVPARSAFQHDLITLMARRAEARPLLGAALLARTRLDAGGPLGFHQLIRRAASAPDAGPAVNWVRLSDCDADADNCPNPQALKALIRQAPDNAAVWLLRMGQAIANGNVRVATKALRKAARARVYDDYTGRSLQALADAVTQLPPPRDTLSGPGHRVTRVAALQVLMVYGIADAQPIPGFHLVAAHCRSEIAADAPARRTLCLQLAHVLVRGSSPLARSLGLHIQTTLAPDPVDRKRARADMRDLIWQVRQFGLLQVRARHQLDVARRLLLLARRGGTQMNLMLSALRASGIPDQAPLEEGTGPAANSSARVATDPP